MVRLGAHPRRGACALHGHRGTWVQPPPMHGGRGHDTGPKSLPSGSRLAARLRQTRAEQPPGRTPGSASPSPCLRLGSTGQNFAAPAESERSRGLSRTAFSPALGWLDFGAKTAAGSGRLGAGEDARPAAGEQGHEWPGRGNGMMGAARWVTASRPSASQSCFRGPMKGIGVAARAGRGHLRIHRPGPG